MTSLNFIRQRGLSIIELMIALLISSILILGITQVYLDSKRNHMYHQGQTANLDTSRFSAMMFEDILSKAGYRRNPERNMREAFHLLGASDLCAAFPAGHVITRLKSSTDKGLCIRYQPAVSGEALCDGTTATLSASSQRPFLTSKQSEQVVLALKFVPGSEQDGGHISCRSNKGNTEVELIEGIADIRVFFAVSDGPYRRIKNSGYMAADDWSSSDGIVRGIRFELLSASGRGTRDGESAIYTNWLEQADSASQTRLNSLDQRHIYQQVVGSQAIRNMMP